MKARLPDEYRGGQAGMMARLQKMQEEMARVQEEVEAASFSAAVGGGAVTAECNGKRELLGIEISPEVVDPEDVEMLQDLVIAAVNEAITKAGDAMEQAMEAAKGGLNLPGMGL